MRYRLRKTSPRLTSTKEIFETKDGAVARLILINDKPLSAADEQKEDARLDALLERPLAATASETERSRRHRKGA